MLNEQKKLDTIGRRGDILYFLRTAIGRSSLSIDDLKVICSHAQGPYTLNVDALVSFCNFFELVSSDEDIELDAKVLEVVDDSDALTDFLIEKFVSKSFENHIIRADFFSFDSDNSRYLFRNEKLPLYWASIRNLLVDFGFLYVERNERSIRFFVAPQFENTIGQFCKPRKKTMSIGQLHRQLEQNIEVGEQAEQYVLDYERKRVNCDSLASRVRVISDIDVSAGYDIVSFNSNNSDEYDRFIEVKAVSADLRFFWSRNELETARLKGGRYYLYLIELPKTSSSNYHPIMICNPASALLESNEWLLEAQTYVVKHMGSGFA